ncbi:MAG TPA: hypothetical protein ENN09_03290, partial [Planctomycetes bacterium]|nr:hypothetical protein [Planctomycetota bacterium]
MEKRSKYTAFDPSSVKTYPLRSRPNKVDVSGFADCVALRAAEIRYSKEPWYRDGVSGEGADQSKGIAELARYIVECRREGKPVILFSGAHPIKNGQAPIIADLIRHGIVTLYATNGASTIHSFELALTGASSESVRDALPKGEFGMAFETGAYINFALKVGVERGMGYG